MSLSTQPRHRKRRKEGGFEEGKVHARDFADAGKMPLLRGIGSTLIKVIEL